MRAHITYYHACILLMCAQISRVHSTYHVCTNITRAYYLSHAQISRVHITSYHVCTKITCAYYFLSRVHKYHACILLLITCAQISRVHITYYHVCTNITRAYYFLSRVHKYHACILLLTTCAQIPCVHSTSYHVCTNITRAYIFLITCAHITYYHERTYYFGGINFMCDMNPTSWAASVAQLVERPP